MKRLMCLNFIKKIINFLFIISIPQLSLAQIEIAFFQYRDINGNIISLENEGQFYHIAIKTDAGWLHSNPYYGVVLVKNISEINAKLALVIKNNDLPELTKKDYQIYLGIPFDFEFKWRILTQTYCSKLIANILNIEPLPLKNSNIITENKKLPIKDTVGLSPDDLYNILTTSRGFNIQEWQCRSIF